MQIVAKNLQITFLVALGASALFVGFNSVKAAALSGSDFNPGRIIDDAVFYNSTTMSATQIQQFLNSKVPVCDTNGTQPYGGTTRAAYGTSRGYPPPYTCLKDYSMSVPAVTNSGSDLCKGSISAGTKSAAQIIYDVAQACGINPQVLIVLLQKEQSLITDDWPWSIQYRSATGYGCPDTAPCDSEYYGFFNQVYQAAKAFRRYEANPTWYNYRSGRNNFIYYHPSLGACGGTNVFIQNQATASLYIYTPYQPNAAALNNLYGEGDGCSAYGNRNFWRMFNDWFGSTIATIYNGVDYFPVFDAEYYLARYPDLAQAFGGNRTAAFNHFISNGISEGRQAKDNFNVISYKNRYPDLRRAFGDNIQRYYMHYILYGFAENRIATGDVFIAETKFNNKDYSSVYDFTFYQTSHPDVKRIFGNNDILTLTHFVSSGMSEGRQAIESFNVTSYKDRYPDLRRAFGENLPLYYQHFIDNGSREGRIATGSLFVGTTIFNDVNYGAVYDYSYYIGNNGDLGLVFGNKNDLRAIQHFVNYGMSEGREANSNFSVVQYKAKYADLRAALGDNYARYFWHYLNYGMAEGRTSQF